VIYFLFLNSFVSFRIVAVVVAAGLFALFIFIFGRCESARFADLG